MALKVNLVSAEQEVWSGEANLVIAKTLEGEIGFMSGHEPVLAILAEGQVRITDTNGEKIVADARDGFLAIEDDILTIVAGNAAIVDQAA